MLFSSIGRAFQREHQIPLRQILLLRLSLHGLGSMCVSSFRCGFSHTFSPKLERCMESFVFVRSTTNPRFRALTKMGQRSRCGQMNRIVCNSVAEESVPTGMNHGGRGWGGVGGRSVAWKVSL